MTNKLSPSVGLHLISIIQVISILPWTFNSLFYHLQLSSRSKTYRLLHWESEGKDKELLWNTWNKNDWIWSFFPKLMSFAIVCMTTAIILNMQEIFFFLALIIQSFIDACIYYSHVSSWTHLTTEILQLSIHIHLINPFKNI